MCSNSRSEPLPLSEVVIQPAGAGAVFVDLLPIDVIAGMFGVGCCAGGGVGGA
jgi:hypothetical protein